MSLREEMWKYEQITGESAEHVPIIKLGAFLDGYEMGLKALEQTKWIPCSEKLPEENIHVLCHFYLGGMAECYHSHGMWHIVGGLRISCDEVIAWMPLLASYKESDNN